MRSIYTITTLLHLLLLPTKSLCSWIDPDTPKSAYTTQQLLLIHPTKEEVKDAKKEDATKAKNATKHKEAPPQPKETFSRTDPNKKGKTYHLVMSDEFNVPNRTFHDGHDPKWTALEKNDYTNDALHFYSQEHIYTNDRGELEIMTEAADTTVIGFDDVNLKNKKVTKHFKSGMLQSWNKFCFTGGIIEAEVSLPGYSDVGGLWPAFWILGNLARHTYVGSSNHMWPWSSSVCSKRTYKAQKINACRGVDHFDMKSKMGRGSPEIDIFEVQGGPNGPNKGAFWQMPVGQPFMSASYQVAPGKSSRPGDNFYPGPGQWYDELHYGKNTSLNILFYGTYMHFRGDSDPEQDYWSDALSFNRQLEAKHFGKKHKYRLEWGVPDPDDVNKTGDRGYLHWFLDDELVFALNGTSLDWAQNGAEISSEPSGININTAVSMQWGFPHCPNGCTCTTMDCNSPKWEDKCGLPPSFCFMMQSKPKYNVDWIRIYQDLDDPKQKVGCSTPERPTSKYIKAHADLYKSENDEQPLRVIQRGRGFCTHLNTSATPHGCGGPKRGFCTVGRVCECKTGWTGPHCLAHDGKDPVQWESEADMKLVGPARVPLFLLVLFSGVIACLVRVVVRRKKNLGWMPVPEVGLT